MTRRLGLTGDTAKQAGRLIGALTSAYLETDASLVEIDPLLITGDGTVLALDAKMSFDENALFRHPDIGDLREDLAVRFPCPRCTGFGSEAPLLITEIQHRAN